MHRIFFSRLRFSPRWIQNTAVYKGRYDALLTVSVGRISIFNGYDNCTAWYVPLNLSLKANYIVHSEKITTIFSSRHMMSFLSLSGVKFNLTSLPDFFGALQKTEQCQAIDRSSDWQIRCCLYSYDILTVILNTIVVNTSRSSRLKIPIIKLTITFTN